MVQPTNESYSWSLFPDSNFLLSNIVFYIDNDLETAITHAYAYKERESKGTEIRQL